MPVRKGWHHGNGFHRAPHHPTPARPPGAGGIGDTLLADTTRAIELREGGYPSRQYIPREEVRMDLLTHSETVTHCPFKGDATYFSFGDQVDMAWSYEHPLENMASIAERLAFDGERLR